MIAPHAAIGCMRLSTERDRDDAKAIAVLHAAFDAGITLLDTADAYCWDDTERGHDERLVGRALSTWNGDRSRITVATKGGITRPDGRWETDGRAKHLITACEHSRRAIDAIGLCNVTVGQIEEARRIIEIDSIQVELSIWQDANILSGVVEYCVTNRLTLLAHRPLGGRRSGPRTAADPVLNEIATRHGATAFEIALAWLVDLSPAIVPIPGVTRVETAQSVARSRRIELTGEDRRTLDDRFRQADCFEVAPFERRIDPAHVNRAVIVWCDELLFRSRSGARTPSSPDDMVVAEDRGPTLRRYHDEGWRVLGLSWQPEIAAGVRSVDDVNAVFARLSERLGLALEVEYCPHGAGPPRCWCRKPLPGLGVLLIHRYQLDPARCIYVGAGSQDPGFARRLGFTYRDASAFF